LEKQAKARVGKENCTLLQDLELQGSDAQKELGTDAQKELGSDAQKELGSVVQEEVVSQKPKAATIEVKGLGRDRTASTHWEYGAKTTVIEK